MTTAFIILAAGALVVAIPLLAALGLRTSYSPSSYRASAPTLVPPPVPEPRREKVHTPQVQRWLDALTDIAADGCRYPFAESCVGQERFYWCHPCLARLALDPRFGATELGVPLADATSGFQAPSWGFAEQPLDPTLNSLTALAPVAQGAEGLVARPGEDHGDPPSDSQGVPTQSDSYEPVLLSENEERRHQRIGLIDPIMDHQSPSPQPDPLRSEVTRPGPSISPPRNGDGPGCVPNVP